MEEQMPRRNPGPRIWLKTGEVDKTTGKLKKRPVWCIKGDGVRIITGCAEEDRAGAEKALRDYIADKHKPKQDRPSSKTPVTDVLAVYSQVVAGDHTNPHKTAERILQLAE